ncbi:hypothetical protein QTN25_004934 [Entamoeba marina]
MQSLSSNHLNTFDPLYLIHSSMLKSLVLMRILEKNFDWVFVVSTLEIVNEPYHFCIIEMITTEEMFVVYNKKIINQRVTMNELEQHMIEILNVLITTLEGFGYTINNKCLINESKDSLQQLTLINANIQNISWTDSTNEYYELKINKLEETIGNDDFQIFKQIFENYGNKVEKIVLHKNTIDIISVVKQLSFQNKNHCLEMVEYENGIHEVKEFFPPENIENILKFINIKSSQSY